MASLVLVSEWCAYNLSEWCALQRDLQKQSTHQSNRLQSTSTSTSTSATTTNSNSNQSNAVLEDVVAKHEADEQLAAGTITAEEHAVITAQIKRGLV